jgi:uncharacterized membrane protein YoaK (UPF0700 family)
MIDFTANSFRNTKHVLCWYGLAFQSGAVNAGGFLACQSFVSHVTGVGTTIGIQVASGHFVAALELLAIPIAYFAGALFSALLIDQKKALGKEPSYVAAMGIIALLYLYILIAGSLGLLGEFGEPFELYGDIALVAALCIACGLQNAAITSATNGTIRTTHLTGIVTDFGINLIKVKHLKSHTKEKYRQSSINKIRLGTFLSFSAGSALSTSLFLKFKYFGFIVPSVTSTVFFIISYYVNAQKHSNQSEK